MLNDVSENVPRQDRRMVLLHFALMIEVKFEDCTACHINRLNDVSQNVLYEGRLSKITSMTEVKFENFARTPCPYQRNP